MQMSEWEQLCKDMEKLVKECSTPYSIIYKWKDVNAVGDKLQRDTKNLAYEITVHKKKILGLEQKLKTGSRMLDEWEKSTTHPDSTLINIRNLKKVFAQNTDYVQKEDV